MSKTTHTAARAAEMYYTQSQTVSRCLAHLRESLPLDGINLFLEPSAGAGAFLEQMPSPKLGIDTQPMSAGIETADYLAWWPDAAAGAIAVVGNPPFGSNGAGAVKFFNHSAGFADVIAMIMPASFSKDSMQNRLSMDFVLVSELPLQNEPFLVEGKPHCVNAVFQIWRRSATPRVIVKRATKHDDFVFVATKEEADFAMRRVGGRAGAVIDILPGTSGQKGLSSESNLFIKAVDCDPATLESRFRALKIAEVRTLSAAHPSISKSDIIQLYTAQVSASTVTHSARLVHRDDAPNNFTLSQRGAADRLHTALSRDPQPVNSEGPIMQPHSDDAASVLDIEAKQGAAQSNGFVGPDTPNTVLEKAGIKLPAGHAIGQPSANDPTSHDTGFRSAVRTYKRRALKLLHIAPSVVAVTALLSSFGA
ncbi:hypothetical protein ACOI1H_23015 [Loktanella sp. DJP18]|uniref:hypothetical protein n=1 Tax=Loktanella sp. DJP18 TaxID=3409788 RepID=UPI003BB614D7